MSITPAKRGPVVPLPFPITEATRLEDWKKWTRSFRYYANSINLDQECHDVQLGIFKSLVGSDALEIYNTFSLLDITDVESVIRKFDEHFRPKVNVTLERYKLYQLAQKPGQHFDEFLADLTNQVAKCEFTSMQDDIVLFKIVGGIDSNEIRNALLADANLKYDKAVKICRASSVVHFMTANESGRQGNSPKKKKLGMTPKISFKEQRRLRLVASKEKHDGSLNGSMVSKPEEVPTNNSLKSPTEENNPTDPSSFDPTIENGSSDEGDGSWKGDDDSDDYVPDDDNVRKSGSTHQRNKKKKKIVYKKKVRGRVSKIATLPCDICGKMLKTELSLERHRSIHVHGQHAICFYCGKQCSKYFLRRHMTGSHYEIIGCPPPKLYTCDICDFKTRFGENLQRHKYQHTGEKPLSCDHCEYRCIRPRLLKAHMAKQHTGERPFTCSVCKRGFLHSDALKKHMVTHMPPEEKLRHRERLNTTCDVCGKVFCSRAALKTHSMLHTGEKPFACDKCGFRTVTKGNLNTHLMIHSEEKPFVCSVCGYSCKQKSILNQHMITHTGEKPYTCDLCGRKFSQSHHLKTHLLTHTGLKPHVCEICGHGFTTRGSLKAHMKVHEKHSTQPSPTRKRTKKSGSVVVSTPSNESRHSIEHSAADAVITWSEQETAINPVDYIPNLETPPCFHPTYQGQLGNPRPPDCRYYQQRHWQSQNFRQDQD